MAGKLIFPILEILYPTLVYLSTIFLFSLLIFSAFRKSHLESHFFLCHPRFFAKLLFQIFGVILGEIPIEIIHDIKR